MDPLVATLVLIVLALVGARITFSTRRVPAGPRLLFRTGLHWLFFGWLLGPGGVGLLTYEAVEDLYPLLAVGLGWVGLLFGMQLTRENLRHFVTGYHVLAFGQAAATFAFFLGVGWLALGAAKLQTPEAATVLFGAAATACVTTPAGIAMVSSNFLVRGNVRQLLFYIASVDAVVGIVALQLTYSFFRPSVVITGLEGLNPLYSIGASLLLAVVCAVAFLWLIRPRPASEELVLFLLGIAALGAGAALQVQLSPLFVCTVMGIVVANRAPDRQRIFQALHRWEKPIYVVLLLLAGAVMRLPTWWVLPLGLTYAGLRAAGKVAGTAALVPAVSLSFSPPRRLGLGLVPQGGISVAMAASLVLTYSGMTLDGGALSATDVLFAIVVIGIVVSELAGPFLTATVLRRAGEILPQVEEALVEGDEKKAEAAAMRLGSPADPTDVGETET